MQFTKANLEQEGNLTYAWYSPNGYNSTHVEFTARKYKGAWGYAVYVDGNLKHKYASFGGIKRKYSELVTSAFNYEAL